MYRNNNRNKSTGGLIFQIIILLVHAGHLRVNNDSGSGESNRGIDYRDLQESESQCSDN